MLFQRLQSSRSSSNLKDAAALATAARAAYQTALNERLPLAHIAEQSGRPQFWFANNIVQIVEIYGSPPGQSKHVCLTREVTNGLTLSEDMAALAHAGAEQPSYVDLRVTREQFERYMTWARTVY
jgi:hypothetical protein